MKFLTNIDLQSNLLLNAGLQTLTTAPTGFAGQVYYDSTKLAIGYYSSGSWTYDKPSLNSISVMTAPTATLAMANQRISGLPLTLAANTTDATSVAYVTSVAALYAPLAGAAFTGTVTAVTQTLGDTSTKVATTAFVGNAIDAIVGGMLYKTYVRTVFTSNQSFTGIASQPDSLTTALAVNDRILLVGQTTNTQNGAYLYKGVGVTIVRVGDAGNGYEIEEGSTWYVAEGSFGTGLYYRIANVGTITADTTGLTISAVAAPKTYTGGTGITVTGTSISLSATPLAKYVGTVPANTASTTLTDGLGTINKTCTCQDPSGYVVYPDVQLTSTGAIVSYTGTPPTYALTVTFVG